MEDESGKNKALGVPGLMLAAGRHVIEDVKGLQARAAPWRELVDHRAVSLPTGVYDGLARLRRNANDLGYNYFLILLALVATCLVMRPSLLLPIAGITALWLYVLRVRAADVVVGGRAFGLHAQRIALVAFAVVVLHFATNVSSVLFSALFWGVVACTAHAALRTPPPRGRLAERRRIRPRLLLERRGRVVEGQGRRRGCGGPLAMVQRRGPGVGAAQRRGVMARVDPPRNNTKHEGTVSIRADKDKDKESLCSYVHFFL